MNTLKMSVEHSPSTFIASHASSIGTVHQQQGSLWSNLKEVCDLLRLNISLNSTVHNEQLVFQHVQFKAGQTIFTMGQRFDNLYIVNSGFLKTVLIDEFGNEQIIGFPMKSDLLCMDGIHTNCHSSEAIALTDCNLILLPFKKLVSLGRSYSELEYAMYGLMSRELVREQTMSVLLGSLSAESRVVRFLISLSDRFTLMGYSGKKFILRMTRQEIGSYLGLTLETVSRTLSTLDDLGLINVDKREIELNDLDALRVLRRLQPTNNRIKQEAIVRPKLVSRKKLPTPPRWEKGEVCAAS